MIITSLYFIYIVLFDLFCININKKMEILLFKIFYFQFLQNDGYEEIFEFIECENKIYLRKIV